VYDNPNARRIQPEDVRRAAYCSQFAGAAGYAYGGDGVWQYRGTTGGRGTGGTNPTMSWKDALQRPAADANAAFADIARIAAHVNQDSR